MKDRIFQRADWLCGAIAALIAFAGYAWTTAPSVTMLDAGEFLVAAQHFGVPHPTGYPLWTLLAWLFHFLPLGNVAWELALFSGVCGALAVGLATMLIRNSALWILHRTDSTARTAASVCAISLGLVFAYSFSMWSQAVIVEVYTLHALLMGLYLTSLYVWLRRPEKLSGIYWTFFTFSLAFSNHQLTLALAPLPFLVVLFVRRDLFWDLFLAVALCALISYLAFAMFSPDPMVVKAAIRLLYLSLTIFAVALIISKGRLHWPLIAFLPFVLLLGLLPYAYMPLASSTNPPMNWSYTRTAEGFFYSFNRSQYTGTLSDLSLKALSKVLGVPTPADEPDANEDKTSTLGEFWQWGGFFWTQTIISFSPLAILFLTAAFLGILRQPRPPLAARVWIYLVASSFLLAMAFQPVLEHATTDKNGWWVQMPYHTYTNFIFSLLCGIGACFLWLGIVARFPRLRHALWGLLLLPLWPIYFNVDGASQRNHWLGWQYGHDMLSALPKGSVIFGGTDAGRFIPTYLILGESTLPPSERIDPSFDRRDLYIITQNALNDRYYLAYIHDQYAPDRPKPQSAIEHWLGRDTAYPTKPLILPTLAEMQALRQKAAQEAQTGPHREPNGVEVYRAAIGAVAKWIFEKNKATHAFFVEESFRMQWSYDYAVPEGLIYRINPEPLAALPPEVVKKDEIFWKAYIERLKATPSFALDYDAQRNFSRLRLTGAYIFDYRKLYPEAEAAYRQAIDLWPGNLDAITALSRILWDRGNFDESIDLLNRAFAGDPNNRAIRIARDQAMQRKEAEKEINEALAEWRRNPANLEPLRTAVTLYSQVGEGEKCDAVLLEALGKLGNSPDFLAFVVQVSEAQNKWQQSADAASRWAQVDPQSAEAFYRLSRAQFVLKQPKAAVQALSRSIDLGGVDIRERIIADPVFQSVKDQSDLKQLMVAPTPGTAPKAAVP